MSTLVVVLCQTRASHLTQASWQPNMLDCLGADLALCVSSDAGEDESNMFYKRANYVWSEPEPKDWLDALDRVGQALGTGRIWRRLLDVPSHWMGPLQQPGSGAILWYFRWRLFHHLQDLARNRRYDWIIVTRSDFVFSVPHIDPTSLNPNFFYVPDGERYGGITDRHIIATPAMLQTLLQSLQEIWIDPESLARSMAHRSDWNPEKFLLHQIERKGLREKLSFVPYAMYSVRDDTVETRWSRGKYNGELNLFVKYRREFKAAQQWIGKIKTSADWVPFLSAHQLKP